MYKKLHKDTNYGVLNHDFHDYMIFMISFYNQVNPVIKKIKIQTKKNSIFNFQLKMLSLQKIFAYDAGKANM